MTRADFVVAAGVVAAGAGAEEARLGRFLYELTGQADNPHATAGVAAKRTSSSRRKERTKE